MRARRRLEILLLFAALAVVPAAVAAVEVGLRLFGKAPPGGPLGPLHVYSEVYGWKPRKGFRMVDGRVVTTINARGYRGKELSAKQSGVRRAVLLGDSVAFGLQVGDDETFAALLDARRADLEVANLAVQGYDPGQELIKLELEGLPLEPDVVILALCLSNDFADASLPVFLYDGRHPKPYFTVEDGRLVDHVDQLQLSFREKTAVFLSEHSRLYGLLAGRKPAESAEHWTVRKRRALRDKEAALEIVARLVGKMAEDCASHGVAFLVAAFPDRAAYKKGSNWLRRLESAPTTHDVEVVDMGREFHARGLAFDDFALDGLGHLSPRGHRAAAEVLERALVERGLLPDEPQPATAAASAAGS